jgi:EmrB/QacA subfamily drug resistance transporter
VTKQQRIVLIISILASFVAFLDGSVVNVALPAIVHNLGGGLPVQQWIVDAYLLTLGSLILIAGSLSDLFGRKKILKIGLIGFGIASVSCALAPSSEFLILCRGLQGIAGALLVPSSLALIISTFKGSKQAKAIGTWTAWTGISFIIGPLVGGFIVDTISWRVIFAINILPTAITLWLMKSLDKTEKTTKDTKVDITGAIVCTLGLCGSVYGLIEQPQYGWGSPLIYIPLVGGLILLAYFVRLEKHVEQPMLSLELFKIRNFTIGNLATIAIYAGLSVSTFLIVISLQQLEHYSAFNAGLSLLPITIIMFFLSPRFGALAGKYGPRIFMTIGPIVSGIGFLMLQRITTPTSYVSQVLPGVLVFGLGLSMTVAPLTSAILGDIPVEHAGIGSAVNNAVSRIAGLIAIAAVGLIVGSQLTISGFHRGLLAMAILLIAGGIISAIGIQNSIKKIPIVS